MADLHRTGLYSYGLEFESHQHTFDCTRPKRTSRPIHRPLVPGLVRLALALFTVVERSVTVPASALRAVTAGDGASVPRSPSLPYAVHWGTQHVEP
ncbi:hypothetical protein ElyMa_001192400 [Elysia marginata]|uniref:Uncharacterized protein n=1 Tax=Elysia marginata TaxID=1093978 RepID=A0AAV4I4I0_9GAST|nr:hypothetical protein ElyMa_001192400 [Elysia marginata]